LRKLEATMGLLVLGYLVLLALTWLTPPDAFMLFLKVYLTLVNGLVAGLALWALITLKKRPRPVPLPELEKEFEKELERLVKEWKEVEGK